MKRVVVTRSWVGLIGMQVCAVKDATDEEILEVCNRENPSGTTNGWGEVARTVEEDSMFYTEKALPVVCENDPERLHFVVFC